MAKEKAPAYPFYPREYWGDENVKLMGWSVRGFYLDLIFLCWTEGSIPGNEDDLYTLFRSHAEAGRDGRKNFEYAWSRIAKLFTPCGERLQHAKVESLRQEKKEYADAQRENGKRGAKNRWGSDRVGHPEAIDSPSSRHQVAIVTPMAKNDSPISDLRSLKPHTPLAEKSSQSPLALHAAFDRCVELHPNVTDLDHALRMLMSMTDSGKVSEVDAEPMVAGMRRWVRCADWVDRKPEMLPKTAAAKDYYFSFAAWIRDRAWTSTPAPCAEDLASQKSDREGYWTPPEEMAGAFKQ